LRNHHCEEQSDEAIQFHHRSVDCFACARNDGVFITVLLG